MGPNHRVESIYGHISVIHLYILTNFGHMVTNENTENDLE